MKIVDRYLIRAFLAALAYCLLFFLILVLVMDGFNNLDEYIQHQPGIGVILTYYVYFIPSVFVQIIPVATLLATLYALGNFNRHNEIVALRASGVSSFQILSPYLFVGILISFVSLLLNETIVPKSTIHSTAIMQSIVKKDQDMKNRSIKNVTLYSAGNRIIFAREYEVVSQKLYDIVILKDNPNQTLKSKLTAKKGEYREDGWLFHDVIQYQVGLDGEIIGEPNFLKQISLPLRAKPEDFIKEASQVEFMSAAQLKNYIQNLKGVSRRLVQRLSVDLHQKIAFPFISFFVILIGAPMAMKTRRAGAMMGVGTGLVIVALYYGMNSICLALGKGGFMPPAMAAWLGNIIFASAGVYLIRTTS